MSEHQYYEFQSLDQPLTSADQTYLMHGTADVFRDRLLDLRKQYSNRPGVITRLQNAGLLNK